MDAPRSRIACSVGVTHAGTGAAPLAASSCPRMRPTAQAAVLVATCALLFAGVELTARAFRLWLYKSPRHHLAFALFAVAAAGTLAIAVASRPIAVRFAAGAALGVAIEAANLYRLRLWAFPGDRLLFFRGRWPIILAAGLPWGVMPAAAPLAGELFR